MAKKLNIITNGSAGGLPVQNQGLKLSKIIALNKIEEHEKFKALYTIDEDLLERIAEDMKANKFDQSQPVHLWLQTDEDENEHFYLIDGYTRVQAAKLAGLPTVPYFEHNFESFDEAHRYALHLQVDRRNLDGADLLKNIELLMGSDYIKNMKGSKSAAIGEMLGVSKRTVDRATFVEKNATEEQLATIASGEATINATYNEIKKENKKQTAGLEIEDEFDEEIKEDDIDDFSVDFDALDDASGDPKQIFTPHSRDMSEHLAEHVESSEYDERLIERFKGGFGEGFRKGFGESVDLVLKKVLEMVREGMSADEIENSDTFADLSFDAVAGKLGVPTDASEIVKKYNK